MRNGGYDRDLAYIHDAGFGDFASAAAPELLQILSRGGVPDGLVVDLGCGSGIWAAALRRAGYGVLGVDISSAMITMARRKAPGARFRVGSFLDAELPACDAVTSLGECLGYLLDGRAGKPALHRLFRRVHASLRPGGLFLFDIATHGHLGGLSGKRLFREGRDWVLLMEAQQRGSTLIRRITTFRKSGQTYRRHQETHRLRLFKGTEVAAALRRIGFSVRLVRGYGRQRFDAGHAGFVARKIRPG